MIRLTLRQLLYFEALSRTLHFGRAAEHAGVSQPALSAQIAEMESKLDCKLFERRAKGVRLTEDAIALQPRIENILNAVRELETVAMSGRLATERRFRLGIIPTVAPYILPGVLADLRTRFPALVVELREAVTATLVEEANAGRIDAFIAALPLDYPGLQIEELFSDRFFLAVPANDDTIVAPIPPDGPALERLMLLEEGHCLRDQALAICGSIRPLAMASYGATSLTTLMQMVAHGLGVTLIPEIALAAAGATRDVRIVPFSEPAPQRRLCLAWRRTSQRNQECAELAGIVREIHAQGRATSPRHEPE
jgi:LysR family hydrogen peroxide-inducible transcriptional activator